MKVQCLVPLFLMLVFQKSRWALVGAEVMDVDTKEAVLLALPQDIPEEDRLETVKAVKKLISDTSYFLRNSTGLPITKVNILIPEQWKTDSEDWKELGSILYSTSSEKSSNAHIVVETSGPYKDGPVAIQHRHCGLQGRRIVLPVEFLTQDETSNKAKLLAREWIKYRYGVFDENGFRGDSRFPEYYKIPGSAEDEVKINDCANIPVHYTFEDIEGQNCSLEVNTSSGLPIDKFNCAFRVVPEENEEVRTSIMVKHLQNISNVDAVCDNDTYPHNSNAPNKQNVFCNGQSIMEVMKQHKDYEMNNAFAEEVVEPTFHLMKAQNFRIVVAVDDTKGLEKLKGLVKNSLDILAFSMPNNSEFGLLKFKGSFRTKLLPLTKLHDSLTDRDVVTKSIDFLFRDKVESNSEDAINDAVEMLIPDNVPQSGTIVVISATGPLSPNSSLRNTYKSLCLVVIAIKEDDAAAFERFIQRYQFDATCSKVFRVFGDDFTALEQINEAFNFAIDNNDYQDQHTLIKGAELTSESPLSWIIDESVSSFDIWLASDTVKNIESGDFQFSELGVIRELKETKLLSNKQITLFPVEEPKAGLWECKLNFESETLLVKVITKTKNGTDSLRLKAWIEVEKTNDEYQSPIILYAEVFSGSYPILHASIETRIISSDGNETILKLLDNGLGDPDVTENDGIYTRYFTQFTTVGDYNVTVIAEDNNGVAIIGYESDVHSCCGSEVKYVDTKMVSVFKITDVITFTTTREKPEAGYEPLQVLDLRVMETSMPSTFTLQWTAPGNERDHDTAKEYELKVFKSKDDAYQSFESNEIHMQAFNPEKLISPSSYGTLETVDIQLNDSLPMDVAYYICLRTISQNGKASKVSNIVEIFYSLRVGTAGTDDPISVTPTEEDKSKRSPISPGTAIGIAIGAFVLVVALVIIGYLSFHCYNKKKGQRKKDVESNGEAKSNTTSNLPTKIDGSVTADEWKLDKDPISPVNSVPAKVLLLHHEQVKDAKLKNQDPPLFTLQRLQETEDVQEDSSPEVTTEPKELQENEVPQNNDQPSYSKSKKRTTNV